MNSTSKYFNSINKKLRGIDQSTIKEAIIRGNRKKSLIKDKPFKKRKNQLDYSRETITYLIRSHKRLNIKKMFRL